MTEKPPDECPVDDCEMCGDYEEELDRCGRINKAGSPKSADHRLWDCFRVDRTECEGCGLYVLEHENAKPYCKIEKGTIIKTKKGLDKWLKQYNRKD